MDVGGTAGSYLTLSASNVNQLFIAAGAKLDYFDVEENNRVVLAPPRMLQAIKLLLSNKDTSFGDKVGQNGYVGRWAGFQIYKTNNAPWTGTLTTSSQITAADTLTIAGVTFTFTAASSAASAGEIALGSDAAGTTDNIVLAVAGTATGTAATYIDVSADDREKLRRQQVVATDATTSITFTAKGEIVVSEGITAAADVWSIRRQHVLFMEKGAIDIVQQRMPYVQFNQAQLRVGKFVIAVCLYGIKTFLMGSRAILDANINADGWS